MCKFLKLGRCIIIGTLATTMLATQVNAKSDHNIDMPTFEKASNFDSLGIYEKENNILQSTSIYEDSAIFRIDDYDYKNDGLDEYVKSFIPLEFNMFDLKSMSENGHGEFKIGDKTFDEGLWVIEWYDDFEACVVSCDESDYEDVLANLDLSEWEKTGDYEYVSVHDEDEGYFVLNYSKDASILTVTKYSDVREYYDIVFENIF